MFCQIALTMHDHNFFQITSWHVGIILQVHGLKEGNLQVISKHHKKKIDMGDFKYWIKNHVMKGLKN
jgi:hypothetical protein